jgi:hypothetical protein
MSDAKLTRPVRKEDVEKNTVVTAVIPHVPLIGEADKEPASVLVKLLNGNKITIPVITLRLNKESFATRSIVSKNIVLRDLDYKAQAEKLEREMRDTNSKIKKLEQTQLTPAASAAQSKDKTEEKKAEEAKKNADAQEAQLTTLNEHYVKLENQLKDVILMILYGVILSHPSMVLNLGPIYKAWSMMMKS